MLFVSSHTKVESFSMTMTTSSKAINKILVELKCKQWASSHTLVMWIESYDSFQRTNIQTVSSDSYIFHSVPSRVNHILFQLCVLYLISFTLFSYKFYLSILHRIHCLILPSIFVIDWSSSRTVLFNYKKRTVGWKHFFRSVNRLHAQ